MPLPDSCVRYKHQALVWCRFMIAETPSNELGQAWIFRYPSFMVRGRVVDGGGGIVRCDVYLPKCCRDCRVTMHFVVPSLLMLMKCSNAGRKNTWLWLILGVQHTNPSPPILNHPNGNVSIKSWHSSLDRRPYKVDHSASLVGSSILMYVIVQNHWQVLWCSDATEL